MKPELVLRAICDKNRNDVLPCFAPSQELARDATRWQHMRSLTLLVNSPEMGQAGRGTESSFARVTFLNGIQCNLDWVQPATWPKSSRPGQTFSSQASLRLSSFMLQRPTYGSAPHIPRLLQQCIHRGMPCKETTN